MIPMAHDPMRETYRDLTDAEKRAVEELKAIGDHFIEKCDATKKCEEMLVAKARMREAVMWAVLGVTG